MSAALAAPAADGSLTMQPLACVKRTQGLTAKSHTAASLCQVRQLRERLPPNVCSTIMLISRRWACQTLYRAQACFVVHPKTCSASGHLERFPLTSHGQLMPQGQGCLDEAMLVLQLTVKDCTCVADICCRSSRWSAGERCRCSLSALSTAARNCPVLGSAYPASIARRLIAQR